MNNIECSAIVKGSFRLLAAVLMIASVAFTANAAGRPAPKIVPLIGAGAPAGAQLAPQAADDPLGRSTPYGTVMGFVSAMEKEDYERAVEYMDTKQPIKRAEQLAIELQSVIDRGFHGNLEKVSRNPEGDPADGLPSNFDNVGIVRTQAMSADIQLERVQREGEPPVWLFSTDTLKRVPIIYEHLEAPVIDRYLPAALTQTRLFHVPLWRWLGFFVLLPLFFVMARLVSLALIPLIQPLIRRLAHRDEVQPADRLKTPLNMFVLALAFYAYAPLSHSAMSRMFWNRMGASLTAISLAWLFLRLVDILVERMAKVYHMTESSGRIAIARLGGQVCKGIAIVTAAATTLYYAGINLTTVLTGLGVGGVAVAFAAQKTLENLFGGFMIASDQPIRVGDYCRAGDYSGVVESIGLRSTRIRTMDRTVVSVPNGQLSTMSLENFAMRDKIRFQQTLSLQSDTPGRQLRQVVSGITGLLRKNGQVEGASARVRLVSLKNSGFEIEVFAYILATSWDVFLARQEELLLGMIDIVEESGAAFASNQPTIVNAVAGKTGD